MAMVLAVLLLSMCSCAPHPIENVFDEISYNSQVPFIGSSAAVNEASLLNINALSWEGDVGDTTRRYFFNHERLDRSSENSYSLESQKIITSYYDNLVFEKEYEYFFENNIISLSVSCSYSPDSKELYYLGAVVRDSLVSSDNPTEHEDTKSYEKKEVVPFLESYGIDIDIEHELDLLLEEIVNDYIASNDAKTIFSLDNWGNYTANKELLDNFKQ